MSGRIYTDEEVRRMCEGYADFALNTYLLMYEDNNRKDIPRYIESAMFGLERLERLAFQDLLIFV